MCHQRAFPQRSKGREPQPTQPSARQRIEQILAEAKAPLSQRQLRRRRSASAPATSLKSWLNPLLPAAARTRSSLDVTPAGRHAAGFRISRLSGLSRKLLHALNRIGQFEMATI
jgi:hypothetical protein